MSEREIGVGHIVGDVMIFRKHIGTESHMPSADARSSRFICDSRISRACWIEKFLKSA